MLGPMAKEHFEPNRDESDDLTSVQIERGTYTLAEAAQRLGLSLRATRKAAATGQIAAVQIGRRWLVAKGPLEALISSRKGGAS